MKTFIAVIVVSACSLFSLPALSQVQIDDFDWEAYFFENRASICPQTKSLSEKAVLSKPSQQPTPDFVVVDKTRKLMHLMTKGVVTRSFKVALGKVNGAKVQEGDNKTPVGQYIFDYKNPNSEFHLSIHISYPNAKDRAKAQELGVSPGGAIFLHGLPDYPLAGTLLGHPSNNWTRGCVAVKNSQIEDLFEIIKVKTPVEICP